MAHRLLSHFRIIYETKNKKPTNLANVSPNTKNSTTIESRVDLTLDRKNQETSVINSAFVNANLQAVLNYAQKVAMRSFIQATLNACHGQNNLLNTFISGLIGNRPHLVARKLLQKQYLFGKGCIICYRNLSLCSCE